MREQRRHACGRLAMRLRGQRGQMAVELAICIPVMLVLAGIAVNLIVFMGDCARFDRIAAEAVRVQGVSAPYGGYGRAACAQAVEDAIEQAFAGRDGVEIEVAASDVGGLTGTDYGQGFGLAFSFLPTHRRYTCTLRCRAAFFPSGVFGMEFPALQHVYELVADPFEPQPWM